MFEQLLPAKVRDIHTTTKADKDATIKRDTVALQFDFTKGFAESLGVNVCNIQHGLGNSVNEITMLDAKFSYDGPITIHATDGSDTFDVEATGLALTGKRPNKEDPGPTVKVTFLMPYDAEDHVWFSDRIDEQIDVKISKRQQDLPGVE